MKKSMLRGFTLITGFIFFSACGPVNSEKKLDAGTSNAETSLKGASSTQNKLFFLHVSGSAAPQVGDNNFSIRSVYAEDLTSPSDQMSVSVTYWMPDMPAMGKTDTVAVRQPDGSYAVKLLFSMAGKWEMTVTLKDGTKQDAFVFAINL